MIIYEFIKSRLIFIRFFYKSISEEDLEILFNTTHWAIFTYNCQAIRFIYADKELKKTNIHK
ncbi:MAG: hypothetical protein GX793_00630 [Bacteroidales bacterium]|jgi:nitroreductase|nr:hypothetical protein [Bacteroidales bacterium]MCK9499885.1 hypothetical protein [Bacteroidales bacterium]MDY0313811.1 hypothetical protein [Bacteroidales bacterium]NLB85546.1 hypothetical protein [Bacteroidales bacterium]